MYSRGLKCLQVNYESCDLTREFLFMVSINMSDHKKIIRPIFIETMNEKDPRIKSQSKLP